MATKTTRLNDNRDGEVQEEEERNVVRELNLFVGGKKNKREEEEEEEEGEERAKEEHDVNNNHASNVGGNVLSFGVPSSLSVLPTSDREVKERLRSLDEPICLFGEGKAERRERLKKI